MPFVVPVATALATIGGTVASISAQRSAAKKAKGQAEQAERIRAQELARVAVPAPAKVAKPAKVAAPKKPLITRAEELPVQAKAVATEKIRKKRERRRTTLVTGPRGLLTEPMVTKPSLLGA